jgi:quinol-cytochrome oxidoreductase complex cytochrome b subunit
MRFFPHYAMRDLLGWLIALGLLAALAALFPWGLGAKADAFAPAPPDIRPEWYFMFMFETLKFVPGGSILGLEYEAIPILGFGGGALLLLLVPFLDRGIVRRGRSPGFTAAGIVVLAYMVALTCYGYRSLVPLWAVLAGAGLVWLFGFAIERRESAGRP